MNDFGMSAMNVTVIGLFILAGALFVRGGLAEIAAAIRKNKL